LRRAAGAVGQSDVVMPPNPNITSKLGLRLRFSEEVGPDEDIILVVTVTAMAIPSGHLSVLWDESLATLREGQVAIELPPGTYEREFQWILTPKMAECGLEFQFKAQAGSLVQAALARVEVGA
jgi:hypothetical protein